MTKEVAPALGRYKNQNPWISIFRIILCLSVIQYHYNTVGVTMLQRIIAVFGKVAVPCFMFLSFYFMAGDIKSGNTEKIQNRLLRLYVPIFVWNMINWLLFNAFYIRSGSRENIIGIKALLESVLFTHYPGMPAHLWFLFAQIVVLVLICIFLSFGKNEKEKIAILVAMILAALVIQYSGVNFELFNGANQVITYSLGRCIECIPFAACALLYAWIIKDKNATVKIAVATVSVCFTMICAFVKLEAPGFGYSGFYPVLFAIAACSFIFLLPDKIDGTVRACLNYVGSCTMGIYCMQGIIGWFLPYIGARIPAIGNRLGSGTLVFDAWIFVVGLLVTIVARVVNSKLNWKWIEWSF